MWFSSVLQIDYGWIEAHKPLNVGLEKATDRQADSRVPPKTFFFPLGGWGVGLGFYNKYFNFGHTYALHNHLSFSVVNVLGH